MVLPPSPQLFTLRMLIFYGSKEHIVLVDRLCILIDDGAIIHHLLFMHRHNNNLPDTLHRYAKNLHASSDLHSRSYIL
jgi:hypothetical protein